MQKRVGKNWKGVQCVGWRINAKILTVPFPSCARPRVSPPNPLVPFSFFLFFLFYNLLFPFQRAICNSTSTRACACRPILSRDLARETRRCIMNNNRAHNIAKWKVARHEGCTALLLCRCSRRLSARRLDFAISPRGHLRSSAFLLSSSWRLLRHPPCRLPCTTPVFYCFLF